MRIEAGEGAYNVGAALREDGSGAKLPMLLADAVELELAAGIVEFSTVGLDRSLVALERRMRGGIIRDGAS